MSQGSKLDAHKLEISDLAKMGKSQNYLAKRYGVARSTMRYWLDRNEIVIERQDTVAEVHEDEPELAVAMHRIDELTRSLRALQKDQVLEQRIIHEVRQGVQARPVQYDVRPLREHTGGKPHVHNLIWSDLHAFEVVDLDAMNGMNEYNWDIAQQRCWNIRDSLASFQANRPYPIDELHLSVLGDMVNGGNHDELRDTNEEPVAVQAINFGNFMATWVESLLELYPRVHVRCVPGNHGRVHKPPSSKMVYDSYDWIGYQVAQAQLAQYVESGQMTFEAPKAGMLVAEIAGLNILHIHGDGIRSTMPGVPWGGVMRRWAQLYAQFAQQEILLDGVELGHFHQACVVPGIFMNGSVKGPDEYSMKNFGSGQEPTQLLLTFNPEKRRLTDVSYINP